MGCEYLPCNDTWDYYINYLNGCKNYEFIDESQIGESQIIRVVTMSGNFSNNRIALMFCKIEVTTNYEDYIPISV